MSAKLPTALAHWAYFLDVDGTLLELADRPEAVHVDKVLLRLICRVHERSDGALALVSGRSLADLDRRLGQPKLPSAGQHGLEMRDSSGHIHRRSTPNTKHKAIADKLMGLVDKYSGLLVEDKGETVAVHYRLAPRLGGYLHRLMRRMVREDGEGLSLQVGKRVVEIKPGGYDKGTAILDFMAEPPFRGRRPVFIGDDLTDEPGFAVVNRLDGVSVKVGRGRSIARYRLRNVAAVREWLEALVADGAPAEESTGESA